MMMQEQKCHSDDAFLFFEQGLTGAVDCLATIECLRVVDAAVASFLVGPKVQVPRRSPDSSLSL